MTSRQAAALTAGLPRNMVRFALTKDRICITQIRSGILLGPKSGWVSSNIARSTDSRPKPAAEFDRPTDQTRLAVLPLAPMDLPWLNQVSCPRCPRPAVNTPTVSKVSATNQSGIGTRGHDQRGPHLEPCARLSRFPPRPITWAQADLRHGQASRTTPPTRSVMLQAATSNGLAAHGCVLRSSGGPPHPIDIQALSRCRPTHNAERRY